MRLLDVLIARRAGVCAQYAPRPPAPIGPMAADDVVRDRAGDGPRSGRSSGAQRRVLCPARGGRLRPRAARHRRCAALAGDRRRGRGAARAPYGTYAGYPYRRPYRGHSVDGDFDLAPPGSAMERARSRSPAAAKRGAAAESRPRRAPRRRSAAVAPQRAAGRRASGPRARPSRCPPDRSSRCRRRRTCRAVPPAQPAPAKPAEPAAHAGRAARSEKKRPGKPGRSTLHVDASACQAALASSTCALALPLPIGIWRGFFASGISRTRSTCRRPFTSCAPETWT